jgi:inosine/xanthosine triphosphatase
MTFNLGSTNSVKIAALTKALSLYPFLGKTIVRGFSVSSGIAEQPTSLEETVRGAMNRAKAVYQDCSYGVGIESGLMAVPHMQGMVDLCVCIIYNHVTGCAYGLSSAFQCPPAVTNLVHSEKLDLNAAFRKMGLTNKEKLGHEEGVSGLLTQGRVTRSDHVVQAIMMAMVRLENWKIYRE